MKPIKNFEGYFINEDGQVFSAWKRRALVQKGVQDLHGTEGFISNELREIKPVKNGNGYLKVHLKQGKRIIQKSLHVLVLETFLCERPANNIQACHNNGVKTDCRLSNLRWGTAKENSDDQRKHGTRFVYGRLQPKIIS